MADEASGFRSLVQQIQERDREQSSQRPERSDRGGNQREFREPREGRPAKEPREASEPREARRELPRRTQGRTDGMNLDLRGSKEDAGLGSGALLSKRWL